MVHDESRAVGRRTALKTMGAAAAAAVGVSGVATATHVEPGDRVYLATDVDILSYDWHCSDVFGPVFESGTVGTVLNVHDCLDKGLMVEFLPDSAGKWAASGWIADTVVAPYP